MGICQNCGRPQSDCVCSPLVVSEFAALRKRVEELSTPLCVGRGTLSILAETGQYIADDGRALIAADDLFKADPWLRAEQAERELERLRNERA